MRFFSRHKYNLLLAVLSFVLIITSELVFHFILTQQWNVQIPIKKYIILFFVLYLFSYIKYKKLRFFSQSFILFFAFFQWAHLSYFGTKIFPYEIWLLFAEIQEITGTLRSESTHILIPFIIIMLSILPIYLINKKWDKKLNQLRFIHYLFLFYLVYNPMRTYMTKNTWGRQPSLEEFDGVNTYLSFSYFLGSVLPTKLKSKTNDATFELDSTQLPPPQHNIIFILGESLTPNHMSLYGYSRSTTPYLDSLKSDPDFFFSKAISSGVSTDISVAFFFNNSFGLTGRSAIYTGKNCLFKLARNQKYETYFYSAQSAQQLRYIHGSICPKDIQHIKALEEIDSTNTNPNAADDIYLIKALKELNLSQKKRQFVVLHMRGTHAPFNLRYPQKFAKFIDREGPSSKRVDHFDNGVLYFDYFMKTLIEEVKTYDTPTLVIYISDHGESLGENNIWGHGQLTQTIITTPFLAYFHKMVPSKITSLQKITHFNISLLLSETLGYQFSPYQSDKQLTHYEVLGNDIDGLAGGMKIQLTPEVMTEIIQY